MAEGTSPIRVALARTLPSSVGETLANSATILDAPINLTATTAYLTAGSVDAQGRSIVPAGTVVGTFQQPGGVRLASAYAGSTATFSGSSAATPLSIAPIGDGSGFVASTASDTIISPYLVPGPMTFQVAIVDGVGGATAAGSASLVVSDVAPIPLAQQPVLSSTQGTTLAGPIAAFRLAFGNGQNLSGLYGATIDWGDGSETTVGTVQAGPAADTYVVVGQHTYADIGSKVDGRAAGTYPVAVAITRLGALGASRTIEGTATVADAPIASTASPIAIRDDSGDALGRSIIPAGLVVGTFTQAGGDRPASAFAGSFARFVVATTPTSLTITLDPSSGVYTAKTAAPTIVPPYFSPGLSPFLFQVVDGVGGASSQSIGLLGVADAAPIASPVQPVAMAVLGRAFGGSVASFSAPYGMGQDLSYLYAAVVDWGDGTAPTAGLVVAGATPGTYQVLGSHTYQGVGLPILGQSAGTYPISTTIFRTGALGNFVKTASGAIVQDVPNGVAGVLNPATDSGVSPLDGITNVVRPIFNGVSLPGSVVTVYAIPTGTTIVEPIGSATTDASGTWGLATSPLVDGSYSVVAVSVDRFGMAPVSSLMMPNAHQGPLMVETQSPQVAAVQFNRDRSQVRVTYSDPEGYLNASSLLNPSAYQFAEAKVKPSALATAGPILESFDSSGHSATVLITLNGGRRFPKGSVGLRIEGTAIGDAAGNVLDGTYHGHLPSGSGQPGSNFSIEIPAAKAHVPTPKGSAVSAVKVKATATTPAGPRMNAIQAKATRPSQGIAGTTRG